MSRKPGGFPAMEREMREKGTSTKIGYPSGKRTFSTRAAARRHLKRTQKRMRTQGQEKIVRYIYGCQLCGYWHMTSQEPRR